MCVSKTDLVLKSVKGSDVRANNVPKITLSH
jgi:hypothetical protein